MKIERDGNEYELTDSEIRRACKEYVMWLLVPQIKELDYFMLEYEIAIMAEEAFEKNPEVLCEWVEASLIAEWGKHMYKMIENIIDDVPVCE